MKIILTEDVIGVGDIGEEIRVRPGFARNFLIPRGFALETGAKNARVMAHKMRQIESKKRRLKSLAEESAKQVRNLALVFDLRVGAKGKVYGSITTRDIAEKLTQAGYPIDRRRVGITEPLKKVGTHFVKVKLHPEVDVQVKIQVNEIAATNEDEENATNVVRQNLEAAAEERETEGADEE